MLLRDSAPVPAFQAWSLSLLLLLLLVLRAVGVVTAGVPTAGVKVGCRLPKVVPASADTRYSSRGLGSWKALSCRDKG